MTTPQVDLLKLLQTLPKETSSAKRQTVLSKIADAFASDAPSSTRQIQELGEALVDLMPSLGVDDRAFLADKLASAQKTPTYLIRRLAEDVPEVAGPVITASPLLVEQDLDAALERGDPLLLKALARRADLTDELQMRIVQSGNEGALAVLLSNTSIKLVPNFLEQLIIRSRTDKDVAAKLAHRADVPVATLADLFFAVSPEDRIPLVQAATTAPGTPTNIPESKPTIEADIMKAARLGNGEALLSALVAGWHFNERTALVILREPTGYALAVLCLGLGLSRALYSSLVILMRPEEAGGSHRIATLLSLYERLSQEGARRVVACWREAPAPRSPATASKSATQPSPPDAAPRASPLARRAPFGRKNRPNA